MQKDFGDHTRKTLLKSACDSHLTVDLATKCSLLQFFVLSFETGRNNKPKNVSLTTIAFLSDVPLDILKGVSAVVKA